MKPVFPATYSTLSPEALAVLITGKYGFAETRCRLLVRGVGDTYLVETPGGKFILRVYRSSHRSFANIQAEVDLLLALQRDHVPVSYPVHDLSNSAIQSINAIEGVRYAVLFTYARGHVVRLLSEEQLLVLGRQMARFHNTSATITLEGERWKFDFETTLLAPLEMLKLNLNENPEDYEWLQQTATRAIKVLNNLDQSGFSTGYCHFDFLPKNFHFEGDTITFFDFDFMGYGWLINDITSFFQHLCLDVFTGRMTQEAADKAYVVFLSAYRSHRPLNEQELVAMPYLSLGFWLFYMGFHTTHDQFFAFTQPSQLKMYVSFLRQLVAKHWHLV